MDCYYCIVSLPIDPVADLCVLDARDDAGALAKGDEVARDWPPGATVSVYSGERLVGVLEQAFRQAA